MCGIFCTPESLVQARLDRQAEGLRQQTAVVARQAARVAVGQRPRGRCPKSDVQAHAADIAWAQYACEGLRYLSGELRQLLGVVVLTAQGIMHSHVRQGELEALVALLDELSHVAPEAMQPELVRLLTLVQAALPQLVLFAPVLDGLQEQAQQALGPKALRLLGWAWQRRAILGSSNTALLEGVPVQWHPVAAPLLALLAVWHNHRIAERGLHRGQSPLMRSGMTEQSHDWLAALGYPPDGMGSSPQSEADPQPPLALAA